MRIGIEDRLSAKVTALQAGPVSVRVDLVLPGGDPLVAVITPGSVERLGLAVGVEVLALLLPPGLLLGTGGGMPWTETRWPARVIGLQTGPLNLCVQLQTEQGTAVRVVLTQDAARELGLGPGARVDIGVLASQVVLARR